METIVFIDSEITNEGVTVDLGAIKENKQFHSADKQDFSDFVKDIRFVCGHNIIHHDLKYIGELFDKNNTPDYIDTLYMSPLVFPKKPYHKLLKDDKLQTDELNNPLNDAIKAKDLFYDEVNAFQALSSRMKWILCALLYPYPEFQGFFKYINFKPYGLNEHVVKSEFEGKICANADIGLMMKHYPIELAYALAIINCDDKTSVTPFWVLRNYPKVENVLTFLRHTPCDGGCDYCNSKLDIHKQLKIFFGFDGFRTYNGEPLQEKAAEAAVRNKSLLAVFPTGGGKSITFQLPALIAGEAIHGLTVVISPLQSLMKDQVDNLEERGLAEAVTINGLLSPVERKDSLDRVMNGTASMLYISPEQLRSKTIERLLMSRNVARFVIDEAHCFSAWGQDFRVDYLYIGDFIRELQKKKKLKNPVPVSCFTATAKQKVITDICDYFKRKLDLDLEIFATNATRTNLHYAVLYKETEDEKYNTLRSLIEAKNCPTIVYASRTKRTLTLAEKLTKDGFRAKPFNGKMESSEKIANQEAFIKNEVQIIVATSAFGMGVDKKDVKLVIHYDISDSLENYVQEAGRAGRDQSLEAECYVLYSDNDLDKHFILLNQTKLSISEIQQVWKAVKDMTKARNKICCSALEIARQAGWDDSVADIETRVKTAISALENAGYVKRGRNVPHVYATSILVKNMQEASDMIETSQLFNETERLSAKRIIKYLISSRSKADAGNDDAESRIDYIADNLAIKKEEVIDIVNRMREIKLLQDSQDMTAYIKRSESQNKALLVLEKFIKLESFILSKLTEEGCSFNLKELNDAAIKEGVRASTVKNIRTINYFWTIKGYIRKSEFNSQNRTDYIPALAVDKLSAKSKKRHNICKFIVEELYRMSAKAPDMQDEEVLVCFSLVGLYESYKKTTNPEPYDTPVTSADIEDALLYLSKIGAIALQGGFLVTYNGMEIKRLVMDNKIRYKNEDYRLLSEFYKQKIQQIHIIGEYANMMVRDYNAALRFVNDYFRMDFKRFIAKYFKGNRAAEIERNITPEKYNQLFDELSDKQSEIITDDESKYIVVAAGPGSGKTRVLVHKLASLLLLEDVKHEQLLMITFSRAAATEFKKRLIGLIGNAAAFVEIKTFHSYCFDLLGKIGSLEESENVVKDAAELINKGEVESGRITKTVVVIDEAQDMDENEFALIKALMNRNDDMRIIAVGDDDQNIYEFRGSDSKYLKELIEDYGAKKYEMTENYRSGKNIVNFANAFAKTIQSRMKTDDGIPVRNFDGIVKITKYDSNPEQPIVNCIIERKHKGSVCVLTTTNDEALRVSGVLNRNNIPAKLIQSTDGFQMYNLAEIRFFLKQIDNKLKNPVISDALWEDAKKRLENSYNKSSCYEICLKMLLDFEKVNKIKYRMDLEEFIKESKYEDFYTEEKETVSVSTIHKSKGREFDTVYMLLNNVPCNTDEEKRKIYVGLTRAKEELYIHCNNDLFDNVGGGIADVVYDENIYEAPSEITLQLTYKDVVLDFFKDKKDVIIKLRSGDNLQLEEDHLCAVVNGKLLRVIRYSKAFKEKLDLLKGKGYEPSSATIRFILAWKGKEDENETAVALPDLCLRKIKAG